MNILFSGAVLQPDWKGGEPIIAKELIEFLSQKHRCNITKSIPSSIDRIRTITRFVTGDHFFLSEILNQSNINGNNVALIFYDFDSSIMHLCNKKQIPVVATQHIYWGLCPKGDFWNNDFVCSCANLDLEKRNCKSCLSKRGSIGASFISNFFPIKTINSYKLSRIDFLSQCNVTVVPSNFMADLYKRELNKKIEVRTIRNGVNTNFYKPIERTKNLGKKRVLFVGGRTFAKGYHHFLKLASEVKKLRNDVEFAAFGWGNNLSSSNVRNLGFLKKNEIPQAYSDSYLLIFPALWDEPFAQVPLESMACGCPVLAYASGGVSEMIKNSHNGILVPRGDFNELLKTLLELIDNESENFKMRSFARKYVKENFSLSRMCSEYERLLLEFRN